ncbi:hypothetical protein NC652_022220 [Populus alba x Populus x berolinensis]|nr:hypothetical protein NC652_022220 [Populus alba x Populus x berolinensis]
MLETDFLSISCLFSSVTKLQVVDVTNRWICYLYVDLFLNLCGIYPSNDHWKELAEQEFSFLDPIDLDLDNSNISGFPGTG